MLFASNLPVLAPAPPAVLPLPPPGPASEGGGATTACGPKVGADDERDPAPPDTPAVGGAMTFAVKAVPTLLRLPVVVPPPLLADIEGGGATTFGVSPGVVPRFVAFASTEGGGCTTSLGPRILPIKLLMNDPPLVCDGGGGTTALNGS